MAGESLASPPAVRTFALSAATKATATRTAALSAPAPPVWAWPLASRPEALSPWVRTLQLPGAKALPLPSSSRCTRQRDAAAQVVLRSCRSQRLSSPAGTHPVGSNSPSSERRSPSRWAIISIFAQPSSSFRMPEGSPAEAWGLIQTDVRAAARAPKAGTKMRCSMRALPRKRHSVGAKDAPEQL